MKKNKLPYTVYCLKNSSSENHKLFIALNPNTSLKSNGLALEKIAFSNDTDAKNKALEGIIGIVGYWIGRTAIAGIKILEIELVLPPHLEYLCLNNELRQFLLERYDFIFTISSGMKINSDTGSQGAHDVFVNDRLNSLKTKDTGMN
jgi:hypothetical protein